MRHRLKHFFERHQTPQFHALKNVSFSLPFGESLGIIGSNGAGKSTLLAIIAGMACPSSGRVLVNGRVAALLELGSGFHPDLTGMENVYLNASLLGFSKAQVKAMYPEIIDFAGIGDFIDEPLRTYSSGMIVRLAFSVAMNVDPDILIIDEVIAVGDAAFQAKCFERIRSFRRAGKTFICVSHSKALLMDICDTAVWLDHGQMMMHGPIAQVFSAYSGETAVPA
jgi:ABC-type polysaccharide/polyol phosphate transport system ATPase subunit